jgi:hypothetical protein
LRHCIARGTNNLVGVADPARELDAIEVFEDLDRHGAPDFRAIPEGRGGHRVVLAIRRDRFRNLAEPAQCRGLEKAICRNSDNETEARSAKRCSDAVRVTPQAEQK